ncbi:MAG TPA: hypothetical protein VI160_08975 [Gemmatimonadales bacterium]
MRGRAGWALGVAALALAGRSPAQAADTAAAARARTWVRPLASLAIPGTGQLLGHQDRAAVYLAAEAVVFSQYLRLIQDSHQEGEQFRALAFQVAQRGFATVRRDTIFEYYETMERFDQSGRFDQDPGPGLAPETDPTTYNGSVWLLARRTFWSDPDVPPPPTSPEYQAAQRFYVQHAVGPAYQWSWRDAALQREAFRELIRRSDNAARRAQNQLGLLVANHLISALDALISSGLSGLAGRPAELHTSLLGARAAAVRLRLTF